MLTSLVSCICCESVIIFSFLFFNSESHSCAGVFPLPLRSSKHLEGGSSSSSFPTFLLLGYWPYCCLFLPSSKPVTQTDPETVKVASEAGRQDGTDDGGDDDFRNGELGSIDGLCTAPLCGGRPAGSRTCRADLAGTQTHTTPSLREATHSSGKNREM